LEAACADDVDHNILSPAFRVSRSIRAVAGRGNWAVLHDPYPHQAKGEGNAFRGVNEVEMALTAVVRSSLHALVQVRIPETSSTKDDSWTTETRIVIHGGGGGLAVRLPVSDPLAARACPMSW